jgi:hypothetical protein
MKLKICSKCKCEKSLEFFNVKRASKDGRDHLCKSCHSIAMKERYAKDPDKYKAGSKKWRDDNIERHRANAKAWAERNPERAKENKRRSLDQNPDWYENYHKNYRIANREKHNEYNKIYYTNNKEKFFNNNAKRRAIKQDQLHPDRDAIIEQNLYITARKLFNETGVKYHVDHIWPLAKGGPHHHDNLQVITSDINNSKNNNMLFKHPDIKTWCDLPDHILKWVKDHKREWFDKVVNQVVKRKKHTSEEIDRLLSIK